MRNLPTYAAADTGGVDLRYRCAFQGVRPLFQGQRWTAVDAHAGVIADADFVVHSQPFDLDSFSGGQRFGPGRADAALALQLALRSLVSALQMQGKLIIAPGVESAAVMPVLWQLGINFIQGPYLQAPSTDMQFDFELDNDSAD